MSLQNSIAATLYTNVKNIANAIVKPATPASAEPVVFLAPILINY